jgi:hypothetical protein
MINFNDGNDTKMRHKAIMGWGDDRGRIEGWNIILYTTMGEIVLRYFGDSAREDAKNDLKKLEIDIS